MKLLFDLRTGEPALDLEGALQEINIDRSFRQYLDVLLQTPILGEHFVPTWGLDTRSIFEASGNPMWESIIKYLIANALSASVEPLITEIESIKLERDGAELQVEVNVKSAYGTTSRNLVQLNV